MKKILVCIISAIISLQLLASSAHAANPIDKSASGSEVSWKAIFEGGTHDGIPYRFLKPIGFDEDKEYPLVLFLHGMAGRGDDNSRQLRPFIEPFSTDRVRKKHPHFFVAPQTKAVWTNPNMKGEEIPIEEMKRRTDPLLDEKQLRRLKGTYLDNPRGELLKALALVDLLISKYNVDKSRIYVIGHSMGGFGTWNAIWNRPDFFAAAIASAGSLLPQFDRNKIAHVPIWLFHGSDDNVIKYALNVNLFNELKAIDANVKFTSIDNIGHDAGFPAFRYKGDRVGARTEYASAQCDKTQDSLEWLFKQQLGARTIDIQNHPK